MTESDPLEKTITMVEMVKGNSHRYNIHINGEFAFSAHEDMVVKFRLLKGTVLTDRLQQEVLTEEEQHAAYRAALRYIGRSMRTVKEVSDKLSDKGYSPEVIAAVIDRMKEQHFVDDGFYATALARQRLRSNKKGSLWIRRELSQKGVDRSQVEQALTQFDKSDEAEQAWELASKRWPQTSGELPDRLRKIIGLLQRRGFTSDAIRTATDRLRKSGAGTDVDEREDVFGWDGTDE